MLSTYEPSVDGTARSDPGVFIDGADCSAAYVSYDGDRPRTLYQFCNSSLSGTHKNPTNNISRSAGTRDWCAGCGPMPIPYRERRAWMAPSIAHPALDTSFTSTWGLAASLSMRARSTVPSTPGKRFIMSNTFPRVPFSAFTRTAAHTQQGGTASVPGATASSPSAAPAPPVQMPRRQPPSTPPRSLVGP
jgi:hypothetical protein